MKFLIQTGRINVYLKLFGGFNMLPLIPKYEVSWIIPFLWMKISKPLWFHQSESERSHHNFGRASTGSAVGMGSKG
jgi:hypothetical protein